jgi:hypothetical protein
MYVTYDSNLSKMVLLMRPAGNHSPVRSMPPKLEPNTETRRLNLVASASWVRKIDEWRREQPDLPNISEAIRRLVEVGLEVTSKRPLKKR